MCIVVWKNQNEKKRSEETQTLCAGCSKAEPEISAPPQTTFPGARDGQNLISWRWSLPLPTNPGSVIALYCGGLDEECFIFHVSVIYQERASEQGLAYHFEDEGLLRTTVVCKNTHFYPRLWH